MNEMKKGMLTIMQRLPGSKYLCKCDCGSERTVAVGHFNTGTIKSCGCHKGHHGHAANGTGRSREYIAYHNMIARCHKPSNKRFKDYGELGIVVCEAWRASFPQFLEDMGPCPAGMQIDRRDNSIGYSQKNCHWVTPKENMANRSVTQIWTVFGEEFRSAAAAGERHKVSAQTIAAWCRGRTASGRFYPPKENCRVRLT